MLLQDLISLSPDLSNLQQSEIVSYLQKAYYIIIDDIKLEPGIFPMLMKTDTFSLDKFAYKATRVGAGSEIAFKEIKDFIKVTFSNDAIIKENTNKAIIGRVDLEFFGFDESDYNAMNAEHLVLPELFNSKQFYQLRNIDDITYGYCLIGAYQYPYPVHTVDGSYIDEYRYDIQWMIDNYGYSTLIIDELVGMLMLLKALQLFNEDRANLSNAKNFDYLCTTFINMFNTNKDTMRNNRTTSLGLLSFGG